MNKLYITLIQILHCSFRFQKMFIVLQSLPCTYTWVLWLSTICNPYEVIYHSGKVMGPHLPLHLGLQTSYIQQLALYLFCLFFFNCFFLNSHSQSHCFYHQNQSCWQYLTECRLLQVGQIWPLVSKSKNYICVCVCVTRALEIVKRPTSTLFCPALSKRCHKGV